ncbi:MAG: AbrB/MazE/SpoVT family DNA-binding domain-containing protein [Candidatus Woesearchaeota archaeon]
MKRKINLVGQNTLTVSLPSKWAKKYNLNKGDELDVVEDGGDVIIRTSNEKKEKKTKIKVHGSFKLIRRYILSTFRRGYDEVYIEFDDSSVIEHIQDALDIMMGFEIVHQGKNHCIIKNLTNVIETEYDSLMRRFFLITLAISEHVLKAFKKNDIMELNNVYQLENTQNKIYLTISKIIINKGHILFNYPLFVFVLIDLIEEVADNYRDLSMFYNNKKIKLSKQTLRLLEISTEYLRDVYDLYYKFTPEKAEVIYNKREEIKTKGEDLLQKAPRNETVLISYLLSNSQLIYKSASSIFSLNVK